MSAAELAVPFLVVGADAVLDLKKREIFPLLTVLAAAAGAIRGFAFSETTPLWFLVSLLPGAVILCGAVFSNEQIGRGDALVLFAIGTWTDLWTVMETALIAAFGAALFSIPLWMHQRKNTEIPFVPFVFAGLIAAVLTG